MHCERRPCLWRHSRPAGTAVAIHYTVNAVRKRERGQLRVRPVHHCAENQKRWGKFPPVIPWANLYPRETQYLPLPPSGFFSLSLSTLAGKVVCLVQGHVGFYFPAKISWKTSQALRFLTTRSHNQFFWDLDFFSFWYNCRERKQIVYLFSRLSHLKFEPILRGEPYRLAV